MQVVLGIIFLNFSNTNVSFLEQKLTWNFYTATKALFTTKRVEVIGKKKFAKVVLDLNSETFIVHIVALEALLSSMTIHHSQAV